LKTKFSKTNLLHILEDKNYSSMLQEFTVREFSAKQTIFFPGQDKDYIFIVKEGRIRVYLAFEEREFSLAILGKGEIYTTHTRAFVTALDDVKLLIMPTKKFHWYMTTHPDFSKTIISVLGQLLKQSFSIINGLAFKDVVQRVVDFLLFEAVENGISNTEGTLVQTNLTMEQIAAIVGSTRQTVSTIISDMSRAEILAKKGRGSFLIPNLEILKQYPHME
jgi:CRP-like cAMP-binding protein